jgi:hypothetical protein
MKNLGKIALIFAAICMAALIVMISIEIDFSSDEIISSENNTEVKPYEIKQLTPEVFSVYALEESKYYPRRYGPVLDRAVKEIGQEYVIESITAVNDYYSQGSVTRKLLVIVSPRNVTTNYDRS